MLLFLHGAYHTASSLLPLIRTNLDLSSEYSDRFLLDNFTIAIPGYNNPDQNFDVKYLQDSITEFVQSKKEIQADISTKLILAKNKPTILALRQPKLSMIGYAAGGALALTYAANNPDKCETLILLDLGIKLNGWHHWFKKRRAYQLLKADLTTIQAELNKSNDIFDKQFLALLMENSSRKGVRSYLDFAYNFDFKEIHSNLTIAQQHSFAKLYILDLLPQSGKLTTKASLKSLEQLIHPKNTLIHKKHTVINTSQTSEANFEYKYLAGTQDRLFDMVNVNKVNEAIGDFFRL
jgi:hypothetical protein